MSEPETKTIDRDAYLKALGLFTVANDHYCKGQEFERALNDLLGLESGNHISDLTFDRGTTVKDFDEALARSHIMVEGAA